MIPALKANAVVVANSEGFHTTALPAASAQAIVVRSRKIG